MFKLKINFLLMNLFDILFHYVLFTSQSKNIDESHGLSHSMDVLVNAHTLYKEQVVKYPILQKQENIIYISAFLHDMCDKKYMNEEKGIEELNKVLYTKINNIDVPSFDLKEEDIVCVKNIIRTMSYSKVKKNGFPDLGHYQTAYHIVRESDLLAGYDFDRAMIFDLKNKKKDSLEKTFWDSHYLFENRVFKHKSDGLLTLPYSQKQHPILVEHAKIRINNWKTILKIR